jgi:hypothetical protein
VLGYRRIWQHPSEIGTLDGSRLLMIDFNQILFDDHELTVRKINEAAMQGIASCCRCTECRQPPG